VEVKVMRRLAVVPTVVVLSVVSFGLAGCGSSSSSSSAPSGTRAAFCAANNALDKASANVTSAAGFVDVLKANPGLLKAMENHYPPGTVGQQARQLVKAANTAVATGDTSALNDTSLNSAGSDVDTYCRVDGSGDPLPSYFGAGKKTAFCSVSDKIDQGTQAAADPAGTLAFLSAHQDLLNQYSSHASSLPTSIHIVALSLLTAARNAIATNNASLLGTPAIAKASMTVSLYCGQNQ
jgi:hypothetical protein